MVPRLVLAVDPVEEELYPVDEKFPLPTVRVLVVDELEGVVEVEPPFDTEVEVSLDVDVPPFDVEVPPSASPSPTGLLECVSPTETYPWEASGWRGRLCVSK